MTTRTFEDSPARRERVPLWIGLVGPSGGGKTFSALRLAAGIERVTAKPTFVIDTEARRSLHYADRFRFRHVPFGEPFGSLDYLAAVKHCVDRGAGQIVIDSMSHEHEGPGGHLEAHDKEAKRLAEKWKVSEKAAGMSAWIQPKADRRRMINSILQLPVSVIFCFRAKEKIKIVKNKDPEPLGWMALAGEELVFEMAMSTLLLPGAGGVPTWHPEQPGERATIKLPAQFRQLFQESRPLDEEHGVALATWAAGDTEAERLDPEQLIAAISVAETLAELDRHRATARRGARDLPADVKTQIKRALDTRQDELAPPAKTDEPRMREPGEEG